MVTTDEIIAQENKVLAARDMLLEARRFIREATKNGGLRDHRNHWGTLGVNLNHLGTIAKELAKEVGGQST